MFITTKIFKRWLIDSLESFFYFNISFFALFTAYNLSAEGNQDGIAYMSVVLSIVVTVGILFYHFYFYTSLFLSLVRANLLQSLRTDLHRNPLVSHNLMKRVVTLLLILNCP